MSHSDFKTVEQKLYRQFTKLFFHSAKSSLGMRLHETLVVACALWSGCIHVNKSHGNLLAKNYRYDQSKYSSVIIGLKHLASEHLVYSSDCTHIVMQTLFSPTLKVSFITTTYTFLGY